MPVASDKQIEEYKHGIFQIFFAMIKRYQELGLDDPVKESIDWIKNLTDSIRETTNKENQ